ncbi:MAG: iron-sulfur cluster assembly protein [Prevotellaceae bacterium]|nr:iron-sulfur cluster assembly protein [Prevotellaceae bacterium]
MTPEERTLLEERIVDVLKTVYDPEIPVDIYNLGLIYRIEVNDDSTVDIDMTFTAPTCPAAEYILEDVRQKVETLEGVKGANVELVFEPEWDKDMMSDEAKMELGFM